jgi:hypothetical protein
MSIRRDRPFWPQRLFGLSIEPVSQLSRLERIIFQLRLPD